MEGSVGAKNFHASAQRAPLANKNLRGKGHRKALSRESATSLKARQRLICAEVVSPGKNEFGLKEKFLDEQSEKEFRCIQA